MLCAFSGVKFRTDVIDSSWFAFEKLYKQVCFDGNQLETGTPIADATSSFDAKLQSSKFSDSPCELGTGLAVAAADGPAASVELGAFCPFGPHALNASIVVMPRT